MRSDGTVAYVRVLERRRAVALARHFREAEGLSIAQIADRLGRSPATVKAYFYDPAAYCKACHPGATERRWTAERVLDAMGEWRARYGRLPSSYEWSMTH